MGRGQGESRPEGKNYSPTPRDLRTQIFSPQRGMGLTMVLPGLLACGRFGLSMKNLKLAFLRFLVFAGLQAIVFLSELRHGGHGVERAG